MVRNDLAVVAPLSYSTLRAIGNISSVAGTEFDGDAYKNTFAQSLGYTVARTCPGQYTSFNFLPFQAYFIINVRHNKRGVIY